MPFQRACGTLLHITSLPSRGGIGDLGPEAYRFADFLAASRQRLWQVLPIAPVGTGNSPYSATSAFAGNPLLISLERLAERGWIPKARLKSLRAGSGNIDFAPVQASKAPEIQHAAATFLDTADTVSRKRFEEFCWLNGWWLEDYALFEVLRNQHGQKSWMDWEPELRRRDAGAMERARAENDRELMITRAIQFFFFEQWRSLHQYCAARGIKLIGDVAIFVQLDSADVWTHPDIFQLDSNLEPMSVSGVPPDFFSETGQRWGNPLYRWEVLKQRGYEWWIQRLRWALRECDIIRLDHFRGFEAYWEIPADEETAVHGRWIKGPGEDLFQALRTALGELPFIAEDLGTITPEVEHLRRAFQLPGMRILQFGFANPGAHIYLPHRYEQNTVAYTGTHDNDTSVGWWNSGATEEEKQHAERYLQPNSEGIHWALIRAALTSVADLCIIPMQDWLGLDGDCRMNVPSRPDDNWAWRMESGSADAELTRKIADLIEVCDRDPAAADSTPAEHGDREAAEQFAA
jgi:4-alpha-glucanotransferase